MDFKTDPRFSGIKPFENRIWLSCPSMHGNEQKWVEDAIRTNKVSTFGENIDFIEKTVSEYVGMKYALALSSGTAALHLAIRLAGEKLYGRADASEGSLRGHRVFCSDCTFVASVNPVAYEGGKAVFIDSEYDSWNMCPKALEKAFDLYPDVKIAVVAHLYGTPAKMQEIKDICSKHGALIIEDAAESFGAKYKTDGKWLQTGSLGDYGCISFNGNKIITGSAGGMFLTDSHEDFEKVRKWSFQSREAAPWYQHKEIGYNYRISNIIAGIVRGQLPFLEKHIEQKKAIRARYEEGLSDLPVKMNPFDPENSEPNYWLSCMTIDEDAMSQQSRNEYEYSYKTQNGKSCPQEIIDALVSFNAEGRPLWKPMHLQPLYSNDPFVTADSVGSTGADIFRRGLCLPSDIKMTEEQQTVVIDIVKRCFE